MGLWVIGPSVWPSQLSTNNKWVWVSLGSGSSQCLPGSITNNVCLSQLTMGQLAIIQLGHRVIGSVRFNWVIGSTGSGAGHWVTGSLVWAWAWAGQRPSFVTGPGSWVIGSLSGSILGIGQWLANWVHTNNGSVQLALSVRLTVWVFVIGPSSTGSVWAGSGLGSTSSGSWVHHYHTTNVWVVQGWLSFTGSGSHWPSTGSLGPAHCLGFWAGHWPSGSFTGLLQWPHWAGLSLSGWVRQLAGPGHWAWVGHWAIWVILLGLGHCHCPLHGHWVNNFQWAVRVNWPSVTGVSPPGLVRHTGLACRVWAFNGSGLSTGLSAWVRLPQLGQSLGFPSVRAGSVIAITIQLGSTGLGWVSSVTNWVQLRPPSLGHHQRLTTTIPQYWAFNNYRPININWSVHWSVNYWVIAVQ